MATQTDEEFTAEEATKSAQRASWFRIVSARAKAAEITDEWGSAIASALESALGPGGHADIRPARASRQLEGMIRDTRAQREEIAAKGASQIYSPGEVARLRVACDRAIADAEAALAALTGE